MQKKSKMKWDTRTIVFLGLLVAMHIVLTRLVVIDLGSYRITVGNLTTVLAGLWFGPVGGGVCGMLADIIGCILKGYAINPLITVAAILWGVIPGLFRHLVNGSRMKKIVMLCIAIVINSILSTLVFTTAGLVLMNGYNFYAIMPGRIAQWAIMTPIYCVLTCLLYLSPITNMVKNAVVSRDRTVKA